MQVDEFLDQAEEFNEQYTKLLEKSQTFYRENEETLCEIRDQAQDVVALAKETQATLEGADLGTIGETALGSFEEQVVEYIRRVHEIEREFADLVLRAKQARRIEDLDASHLSTNLADKADDLNDILDLFENLGDGMFDF